MRILQVCPNSYQNGIGGVSDHVMNIAERLAKGHDVTVFATNPNGRLAWREVVNGVKVQRFRCFAPGESYYLSADMLANLRRAKFDVVHGHNYHAFPMHFSSFAKCKKFVVTAHFHGAGSSVFRNCLFKVFKPIGKRTLCKADKIVAVSEFEKHLLCEQFAIDPSRVVVVPNGVDFMEYIDLKPRRHDFKSILYVGRLQTYKGVQYLIETLPTLDANVRLEIVGKGFLKDFLKKRAKELKVDNRVLFFQDLSRKELLQKYADADAFVLLSRHEAYSIAVAEALVAGTPCIVANASALTEWIDNESCFGVNYPIDISELSNLINSVLEGNIKRRGMKKWMRTKIVDWNDVSARLEKIYES